MAVAHWSREADDDLDGIWDYIAFDSPSSAARVLRSIAAKCDLLATQPEMGELRPDVARELRSFSVGNYVIYYRPISGGIEVARVLHGAREIEGQF